MDNVNADTATVPATPHGHEHGGHEHHKVLPTATPSLYEPKETKFTFKGTRDEATGEVIPPKRKAVLLNIPLLTDYGFITSIEDDKTRDFVRGLVNDEIQRHARLQVNDDVNPVNTQEELNLGKLTLSYIVNMPPAERRGGGISKEIWLEFAADYRDVLMTALGKDISRAQKATDIVHGKYQAIKSNKPVLEHLKTQLEEWAQHSTKAEEFEDCFKFLYAKLEALLNFDESIVVDSL